MTTGGRQTVWILQREVNGEPFTDEQSTYETVETISLKVEPIAGSEPSREEHHAPQTRHKITCHYRAVIEQGMRFVRGARVLEIESVINVGEANRECEIIAVEVVLVNG